MENSHVCGTRLTDGLKERAAREHLGNDLPHERGIVNNEYLDQIRHGSSPPANAGLGAPLAVFLT